MLTSSNASSDNRSYKDDMAHFLQELAHNHIINFKDNAELMDCSRSVYGRILGSGKNSRRYHVTKVSSNTGERGSSVVLVKLKNSKNEFILYGVTNKELQSDARSRYLKMLGIPWASGITSLANPYQSVLTSDGQCGLYTPESRLRSHIIYCRYDRVFNSLQEFIFEVNKLPKIDVSWVEANCEHGD